MTNKLKQIYETKFKPLYNQKNYTEAFIVLSKNKDIKKYLSPVEKRFMTMELSGKMRPELEAFAMWSSQVGWEHRN